MASKIFNLILASGSPRRRELLEGQGLSFEILAPDLPERREPGEAPDVFARRLAEVKALAIWEQHPDRLVLAADTVVALGGTVLGKPADRADAIDMLRSLSGLTHEVITGVCLRPGSDAGGTHPPRGESFTVRTAVRFRTLSPRDIETYVDTGEPMDKAGAYAIQGRGGGFVEAIFGSYSNVVGLPLAETLAALERAGFSAEPTDQEEVR